MEGVVLQTYGAGNAPDTRTDLIMELKKACDRGVIIVNCSQCASGYVTEDYAAGRVSFGNVEGSGGKSGLSLKKTQGEIEFSYIIALAMYNTFLPVKVLQEAGVVPGHDMTTEAALTKLSFLLGQKQLSCKEQKTKMGQNLSGEMTLLDLSHSAQFSIRDTKILTLVAETMRVTSAKVSTWCLC